MERLIYTVAASHYWDGGYYYAFDVENNRISRINFEKAKDIKISGNWYFDTRFFGFLKNNIYLIFDDGSDFYISINERVFRISDSKLTVRFNKFLFCRKLMVSYDGQEFSSFYFYPWLVELAFDGVFPEEKDPIEMMIKNFWHVRKNIDRLRQKLVGETNDQVHPIYFGE